jgi:hypothetical protein
MRAYPTIFGPGGIVGDEQRFDFNAERIKERRFTLAWQQHFESVSTYGEHTGG